MPGAWVPVRGALVADTMLDPDPASGPAPVAGGQMLTALGKVLLRPRSPAFEWSFAVAALAVALGLRLWLAGVLPPGFPFLTFLPAALLTAVFASIRSGIVVAVLSGLIAWFLFLEPGWSFRVNAGTATAIGIYAMVLVTLFLFIAATERALRDLREARAQADRLARGRELMLSEMQHRVSNKLAMVAALLRAQSARMGPGEARDALAAAQQRIMTISRLQRLLHRPDRQSIELSEYLAEIAQDATEAAGLDPGVLRLELEPWRLARDQTLPLGLIVCELLLNAFEHAASVRDLTVRLRLERCPVANRIAVTIEDNGPGLAPGFDLAQSDSLGLTIARQFAEQLDGSLTLETGPDGGARARLEFLALAGHEGLEP